MAFVSEPDGVILSIVCQGVFLEVENRESVMTPDQSRALADRLNDLADLVEERDTKGRIDD